jgi:plasmid stabilization system protein ParE
MKYTVVWQEAAEEDLGRIWLATTNRQAVADAADRIDVLLRSNPKRAATSDNAEFMEIRIPPLKVAFLIQEDDRRVVVASVWADRE